MGDIWGDSSSGTGREEGSLRRAAVTGRWAGGGAGSTREEARGHGHEQRLDVRPLPSQRVGSYQNRYGNAGGAGGGEEERPGSSQSQGAASGRDRLKARLGSQRGVGGGGGGSYATEGLSGWQGKR